PRDDLPRRTTLRKPRGPQARHRGRWPPRGPVRPRACTLGTSLASHPEAGPRTHDRRPAPSRVVARGRARLRDPLSRLRVRDRRQGGDGGGPGDGGGVWVAVRIRTTPARGCLCAGLSRRGGGWPGGGDAWRLAPLHTSAPVDGEGPSVSHRLGSGYRRGNRRSLRTIGRSCL